MADSENLTKRQERVREAASPFINPTQQDLLWLTARQTELGSFFDQRNHTTLRAVENAFPSDLIQAEREACCGIVDQRDILVTNGDRSISFAADELGNLAYTITFPNGNVQRYTYRNKLYGPLYAMSEKRIFTASFEEPGREPQRFVLLTDRDDQFRLKRARLLRETTTGHYYGLEFVDYLHKPTQITNVTQRDFERLFQKGQPGFGETTRRRLS